ncbi:MAG: tetratricopeptide repeat protein [Acidobacteria bacterium]|nr:tetratricopeptide repeat protein [Acidobacteriota bacterium]
MLGPAIGGVLRPCANLTLSLFLFAAISLADTIYLKNSTIVSTRRAWEEGDEIKYEAAGGIKSLPKSAVLKLKQIPPVIVERVPVRHGAKPSISPPGAEKPVAIPLPAPQGNAALSLDALQRLRTQVHAELADANLRTQLIGALNAEAALMNGRNDHQEAIALLREALALAPNDLNSLINLAGALLTVRDLRAAEETLIKAEAIDDQNLYVHFLLGEAYYAQEKIGRAAAEWNTSLKLSNDPRITRLVTERLKKVNREMTKHAVQGQLTSRHFILRYDHQVADYTLGQNILNCLEGLYTQLAQQLLRSPPETVTVILSTKEVFFDITRAPNWAGGIFDGKIRVPVKGLTEVSERLRQVLTHELAHAFIALATGRKCPAWLNEGVAQWHDGRRVTTGEQRFLATLLRENALWPLRDLVSSFGRFSGEDAHLAYMEARSAVDFLVGLGRSAEVIKIILEQIKTGADIDTALKRGVGLNIAEFEIAWHDYLIKEY